MLWEIGGHTLQDMISCPLPKIMNNIITAFCIMVLWKKTYWSNLHNPKSIIKGSFVTLLVFAEYVELFCRFYFKFAFWLRVLLFCLSFTKIAMVSIHLMLNLRGIILICSFSHLISPGAENVNWIEKKIRFTFNKNFYIIFLQRLSLHLM